MQINLPYYSYRRGEERRGEERRGKLQEKDI